MSGIATPRPDQLPGVCIVNSDGTGLQRIVADGNPTAWSPGGPWLLFQRGVTLHLVRTDGTGEHPLTGCYCQEWTAAWTKSIVSLPPTPIPTPTPTPIIVATAPR